MDLIDMKKLFLILLILIFLGNLFIAYPKILGYSFFSLEEETETGFVTKIIDGDTIVVDGEHIRLLGIDTSEKGEPCYKEAKDRLADLILNKEVILEKDVKDKDQYKRFLRYVFIDDKERLNINLQLVAEGLAIARFYENTKYKEDILEAEKIARESKIGCKWR
ncbi:MAG: hypothetical protein RL557_749 [archaeon]|jgi:micrococcal nuclease